MGASVNRQIRDALVGRLTTVTAENGYDIAAAQVSVEQKHYKQVGKFPHLIVEFAREEKTQNPSGWVRCVIEFYITGYLRGADHDEGQDLLAKSVEEAIAKDPTFGGLAVDAYVKSVACSSSWIDGYGLIELAGEIVHHHRTGRP